MIVLLLLLDKPKYLNLSDTSHKTVQTFLSQREQFISINDTNSSNRGNFISGVPQGFILGLLILIFYINDIFSLNLMGNLQLYANNAAITYKATNSKEHFETMSYNL